MRLHLPGMLNRANPASCPQFGRAGSRIVARIQGSHSSACREDPGAGIAAWVRLLLPAILGTPLPEAAAAKGPASASPAKAAALRQEQASACLSLLDGLLSSRHGGKKKAAKGAISEAVLASCSQGIPAEVCTTSQVEML